MIERASRVVLIVEDYDSMRTAIERLLHVSSYECVAYSTAEDLLAAEVLPDAVCVVIDLRLPGMNGFELLTELHRRGGFPPVILMTAHDAPAVREEATQRGAAAFLAKPFSREELLAAVEVIARSGMQRPEE